MLAGGDFGGHSGISDTSNRERARDDFRTTLHPSLALRTFYVMIISCTCTSFAMPIIKNAAASRMNFIVTTRIYMRTGNIPHSWDFYAPVRSLF